MAIPAITVRQRRARMAGRHRLAAGSRAATPTEVAESVVALHATDPATVHLAVHARMDQATPAQTEAAIYDDRSLIRLLGMRRTMFVVPLDVAPVMLAACTRAIAAVERRKTEQFIAGTGITDDPAGWLVKMEQAAHDAVAARGAALSTEVSADVPELTTKLTVAIGKNYQGTQSVASRVLPLLGADGRIVRGRPRGSWVSSQYRWSPIEAWLPGGVPDLDVADAQAELARRWLAAFGPATPTDLKWWAGWTVKDTKRALAAAGAVEVDMDGVPGVVLPDDVAPGPEVATGAWLLPGLDPTIMGWKERDWYLGGHDALLFDTNGNAGPTVWWDGRVIGGWGQRPDGEVVWRLLEDAGAEAVAGVEAEAARLNAWLDGTRVAVRFPSPIGRELSA
jgi:hypothetical protein